MRKLWISKGDSRYDPPSSGAVSWDKLVEKLTAFTVTRETFAEYCAVKNQGIETLKIKDVGWFVGGPFKHNTRRKEYLRFRSILALDLDHLESWEVDTVLETYQEYAFVLHSSHSHSYVRPRLRLVMPFTRDVLLHEYEPIGRRVAEWFDMDAFDDTGFQVSRVMFWPSRSRDGDEYVYVSDGKWLDPDEVLDTYEDSNDFAEWPHSSRMEQARPSVDKAEDPFKKPGVIGAFNRAYPIDLAIEEFELPYIASGFGENRYSYTEGSSVDGAIYYEDDGHLYSWHESDPARGNQNAWDLVRIHKFGDLDPSGSEKLSPDKLESQKAMSVWALDFDAVTQEMVGGELEDITDEERKSLASFDSLYKEIKANLAAIDYNDLQRRWLPKIAGAKLIDTQAQALLRLLQKAFSEPPTIDVLQRDLRSIIRRKGGTSTMMDDVGHVQDIEHELAMEVLREHFGKGRHLRRVGKLYWTYEKGLWAKDDEERIRGKIAKTILRLRTERPEDIELLVTALGESRITALTSAINSYLAAYCAQKVRRDDPLRLTRRIPKPILNLPNCEIHFDKDGLFEVQEHDPSHFFTTQLAVAYEADAVCPEWDRFCGILFANSLEPEEMQRHLEEVCGYAIQMSRWLKTWVLFHGSTNTGKTTIADVLKTLLGAAALEQPLQSFEGANVSSFARSALIGKLIITDDDQNKNVVLPDGFLKKVSEEKVISSDIKFGDQISFVSRALPIVLSNHWPQVRDLSDALRDRALVFHFNHPISSQVRSDSRKNRMLTKEAPGILNRFLAGIGRLRARGHWDLPWECLNARQRWVDASNPLTAFIEDRLHVDKRLPLQQSVKATELWSSYTAWCRAEGVERRNQLTRRNLYQQLEAVSNGLLVRQKDRAGVFRVRGVEKAENELD